MVRLTFPRFPKCPATGTPGFPAIPAPPLGGRELREGIPGAVNRTFED